MDAFGELGFDNVKWMSGFLITKPPFSPSLGWHQVRVTTLPHMNQRVVRGARLRKCARAR